jgi:hypothetical protein
VRSFPSPLSARCSHSALSYSTPSSAALDSTTPAVTPSAGSSSGLSHSQLYALAFSLLGVLFLSLALCLFCYCRRRDRYAALEEGDEEKKPAVNALEKTPMEQEQKERGR